MEDGTASMAYVVVTPLVASLLAFIFVAAMFPILKEQIETKNGNKPKAYFQFWASQVLILVLGLWTVIKNFAFNSNGFVKTNVDNYLFFLASVQPSLMLSLPTLLFPVLFSHSYDISTPTQCCCCFKNVFHIIILCLSFLTTFLFLVIFISTVPSIILIYFLNPVQTLAHFPFTVNSILYVNSLMALLLYQFERCCIFKPPDSVVPQETCCNRGSSLLQEERARTHHQYYHDYHVLAINSGNMKKNIRKYTSCVCAPIGTFIVLVCVVLFVIILSGLFSMDRSKFANKDEMELLFTLVPSVALLFGSIYNLNFFYKDNYKKSESEEGRPSEVTPLLMNTRGDSDA